MTELYLPPSALRDLRLEREAQTLEFVETARQSAVCREFDPLLQRIDPLLSMVFCREPAPHAVVAAGARPGRYNVLRESHNGGPRSFMPIVGPNGEFVEPTSRVFETLKSMDSWNPAVQRERREREESIEKARAKREADELREANEDVLERYKAVSRAQVSMNTSVPWAQNWQGERAAKAEAARRKKV
jgi:hypothetical protein